MATTTKERVKTAFHAEIDRDKLLAVVGRVRGVVERRNTIPILANLKLEGAGGRLRITGTDLDIQLVDSVECAAEGETTVAAEQLAGLISRMPSGGEVAITLADGDPRLNVRCGRSSYKLPVLPADGFPSMEDQGLGEAIDVDTNELVTLIGKTAFSMSTEETRYYLCGLYLHPISANGVVSMRAVATDGKRLSLADIASPNGYDGQPGIIIPRKTVREITRLLESAGETTKLRLSSRQLRVEAGTWTLTSKVIDGSFPPYDRVVPWGNERKAFVDRTLLTKALERITVLSAEASRPVKLDFEPGKVSLALRTVDAAQGDEEVEADYDGEPTSVGFNTRYLLETLAQIEDERVEFRMAETSEDASTYPVLLIDPSNDRVMYVVMPLRA